MEMVNSPETENVPEPAKEGEPKTQLNEMDNAPDSNQTNNEETSQPQIEMDKDQVVNSDNKEQDPETEQAVR